MSPHLLFCLLSIVFIHFQQAHCDCPRSAVVFRSTRFPVTIRGQFSLGVYHFYDFLSVLSETGEGIEEILKNQPEMKRTMANSYAAFKKSKELTEYERNRRGEELQKITSDQGKVHQQLPQARAELRGAAGQLQKANITVQQHRQNVENKQDQIYEFQQEIWEQEDRCGWWFFNFVCKWIKGTKRKIRALRRSIDLVREQLKKARQQYKKKLKGRNKIKAEIGWLRLEIFLHQRSINKLQKKIKELAEVHEKLNKLLRYVTFVVGRTDTITGELDRQVLSLDQFTLKIRALIDHFYSSTTLYNQLTSCNLEALQEKLEHITDQAEEAGCDLFGKDNC